VVVDQLSLLGRVSGARNDSFTASNVVTIVIGGYCSCSRWLAASCLNDSRLVVAV
jgi:hypothetical protein